MARRTVHRSPNSENHDTRAFKVLKSPRVPKKLEAEDNIFFCWVLDLLGASFPVAHISPLK